MSFIAGQTIPLADMAQIDSYIQDLEQGNTSVIPSLIAAWKNLDGEKSSIEDEITAIEVKMGLR